MKPISKTDQRLQAGTTGFGVALFGLPFACIGVFLVLVGLEVVQLPQAARGPLWIVTAIGGVFAAAGLYLIALGLRGYARRRVARRFRRECPEQPWLYEYAWMSGGVRDFPARRAAVASGMAVFVVVFLAPFNWWAFWSSAGSALVIGITGFFDLIALLLVASASYLLLGAVKYGRSQIAFSRFPYFPGEDIEVGFSPNWGIPLETTVRFVEERMVSTERHGERSSRYEAHELWSADQRFEPGDGRSPVPIRFTLPDGSELVNAMQGAPTVRYWELVVEAHQPGVDFRTTFPLPVYPRPAGTFERERVESLPAMVPRRPQGFERRLVAAAVAAAVAALVAIVAFAPDWVTGFGRAIWRKVEVSTVVESVPDVESEMMDVTLGPDGAIWAVGQTGVYRIPIAAPDDGETVFRTQDAPTELYLQSMFVSDAGVLWLGGWDGEVMTYDDAQLRVHSSNEDKPSRAVEAMIAFRGDIYAGANGVWQVPRGGQPTIRLPEIPERLTEAFAAQGDRVLYAAVAQALWRLDHDGWNRIWVTPRKHGTISAVVFDGDTILAGTYRGLYALEPTGAVRFRALDDYDVRAILVQGDRLWIASDNRGLLLGARTGDGEWRGIDHTQGLPDEDLTGIAIDPDGRLWMSFFGGGLAVAAIDELIPLMTPR